MKTKYMLISCCQNAGLKEDGSSENAAKLKYFRILTNQNCVHEDMKCRLNFRKACYCSLQNRWYYVLLETANIMYRCDSVYASLWFLRFLA